MQPQRKLVLGQTTTHDIFPPLGLAIKSSLPLITVLGPRTVRQHGSQKLFIQFKSPIRLCGCDLDILMKQLHEVHLSAVFFVVCCDGDFPECSTVAFITAGCCCGTEWDQKMCCFCTNSDVIGTANQTVWTGGTACNRCVGVSVIWSFSRNSLLH